jgi:hypothetical protein
MTPNDNEILNTMMEDDSLYTKYKEKLDQIITQTEQVQDTYDYHRLDSCE